MADRPIELALNRPDTDSRLVALTDRLLALLATLAPDYPGLDADQFRNAIDHWRTDLRDALQAPSTVALVTRIVAGCEQFFARVRAYEGERDAELGEIVGVLREVLGALRGGADGFDRGFEHSATQLSRLGAIEDIRELRRALSKEVDTLKRLVSERQQVEQAALRTLGKRVENLEANLKEAREEASTDGLTGVANRRTFDRTLARFVARAAKGDFRFTLALVDLDDFKKINDEHGHQVGDRVLMCVGNLLSGQVRANDIVARIGGEEFALLLEQASVSQARPKLNALIASVAKSYSYEAQGQPRSVSFTFSMGATEYADGDSVDDLVQRADDALYAAKRKGKHRLEITTRPLLKRLLG
jgi:diguanylate cyclase (GGDEF)-like protein